MKKLLALALVALMAGGAMALEYGDVGCGMGLFFSNTEFTDATTNTSVTAAPFNAYIVAIGLGVESVSGYEVGITMDASIFVLAAAGENGWTNFGDNVNHLAGFSTPVNATGGAAVLCTLQMLYSGSDPQDIVFGPSTPSSWGPENPQGIEWDGPAIADGTNADILYTCFLTGGVSDAPGLVATLHGDGITATENHTLSDVKALFE